MRKLPILAIALLSATAAQADWDCSETARREVFSSAAGVSKVVIIGRAGKLKVVGKPGSKEVRAQGTACASNETLLKDTVLVTSRVGGELTIEAKTPDMEGMFVWGSVGLDFEVSLPAELAVAVRDGSGPTEIGNVASLDVNDGSGELSIDGVRGAVDIVDGSGPVSIRNIGGNVEITDGSGSIEAAKIGGTFTIGADGSGSVDVEDVRGDVVIESKGSGSVQVDRVDGDFTVSRKGSGSVDYANVRGRVSVPSRHRNRD